MSPNESMGSPFILTLKITFSGHNQNVTAAVFLADGKRVASGGEDRTLRICKVADGKQERDIAGLGSEFRCLSLLADDRVLSAGSESKIRVHQVRDGKQTIQWNAPAGWISSLAVTADEKTLFFGDQAGHIHRIELKDGADIEQTWRAAPP